MKFVEMRKRAGYKTQDQLASVIGVQRAAVAKWEAGISYPRGPMMADLARLLKCSTDDIIAAITAAKEAG